MGTVGGVTAPDDPRIPAISASLQDARPVLAVGIALWALAIPVSLVVLDSPARTVVLCVVGIVVGLAGGLVYLLQRRGVERGDRGAQDGILVD